MGDEAEGGVDGAGEVEVGEVHGDDAVGAVIAGDASPVRAERGGPGEERGGRVEEKGAEMEEGLVVGVGGRWRRGEEGEEEDGKGEQEGRPEGHGWVVGSQD